MQRPLPFGEPIHVTRPLLPPLAEYVSRLESIWQAKWLTNRGQQHEALERQLAEYLGVEHLSLFANGTLALLTACRVLKLEGEIITTPFTFPATPHAITWAGAQPVFADIDPVTLTLDPASVEQAITSRTSAIMAVHVYGIPCAVEDLSKLAKRHGIKVIYDAAHAFGTRVDGVPIGLHGDATMLSFHATKLFHTAEGGALIVRDASTKATIDLARNFGIRGEFDVLATGINAKMNELSAALGLCVLPLLAEERSKRARVVAQYDRLLTFPGIEPVRPPATATDSLQYYVIRVKREQAGCSRDELYQRLKQYNVFTRMYFYPLGCDYGCYRGLPSAGRDGLTVARKAAVEVLCLPLYGGLTNSDVARICETIAYCLKTG